MSLNPLLLRQLETYGLTDEYLEQLLAVCKYHTGQITWYIHQKEFVKVEVSLCASRHQSRHMRDLTHLLQKEQ